MSTAPKPSLAENEGPEEQRADRLRVDREKRAAAAEDAQTGFHWRDGWFFKRVDDGGVRVSFVRDGIVSEQEVIPENEWASIVCSVSAIGETRDRWMEVRRFHGLETPDAERPQPGTPISAAELSAQVPRLESDLAAAVAERDARQRILDVLADEGGAAGFGALIKDSFVEVLVKENASLIAERDALRDAVGRVEALQNVSLGGSSEYRRGYEHCLGYVRAAVRGDGGRT